MKWPEQHRYVFVVELFQKTGNYVNVTQHCLVFCRGGLVYLSDVKLGIRRVKCLSGT